MQSASSFLHFAGDDEKCEERRQGQNAHSRQSSVDRSAPRLDRDNGVEDSDSSLEWLQVLVLVREYAEIIVVDSQANACVDVLLRRLEPRVALGLEGAP